MRPLVIIAAAAALALTSQAQAFTAQNGLFVEPTGPGEFTVPYRVVQDETAYWCAAGDFVSRALNLPNNTRIYRASPKPRRQGQGISFTLDAALAAPGAGISSFGGRNDGSVSAGKAVGAYCSIYDIFPFD